MAGTCLPQIISGPSPGSADERRPSASPGVVSEVVMANSQPNAVPPRHLSRVLLRGAEGTVRGDVLRYSGAARYLGEETGVARRPGWGRPLHVGTWGSGVRRRRQRREPPAEQNLLLVQANAQPSRRGRRCGIAVALHGRGTRRAGVVVVRGSFRPLMPPSRCLRDQSLMRRDLVGEAGANRRAGVVPWRSQSNRGDTDPRCVSCCHHAGPMAMFVTEHRTGATVVVGL